MNTIFIQEEKILEQDRCGKEPEPEYEAALEHYDGYYDSIIPEDEKHESQIDRTKLRNVILLTVAGVGIVVICFLFVFKF